MWEVFDDRLQFISAGCSWLLLQMPIVFLVVLPHVKVWFLGVVWLVSGVFGLEVIRFERFVVILLMFMMLLMSSCIVTLLFLLYLT